MKRTRWTSRRKPTTLMQASRRCSMLSFWAWVKWRTLGHSHFRRRVGTRVKCKPTSTSISRSSMITTANTKASWRRKLDTPISSNILTNTIRTSSRIHSSISSRMLIQKRNTSNLVNKITCSRKSNFPKWKVRWKVKILRWKRCWKPKRSQRAKMFISAWDIEIAQVRRGENNRDLDRHIRCLKKIF